MPNKIFSQRHGEEKRQINSNGEEKTA